MREAIWEFFTARPFGLIMRDLVDIFIVAYVVYRALLIIRGTRAMQMGLGLGVVFLVYLGAKFLHLVTLLSLLSSLLSSIILIVIVVFQNDIRRALIRVGGRAWLPGRNLQETRVIDEVVAAATELARHRVGALIAFEQDANLLEFTKSEGIPVGAQVTRELLVALFFPEATNKLHDGAVLIRDLKIERAGVFFPMPETKMLDASLGSRHRAALGITEETDAVVVVVSEERGTISFCFSGNIVSNLDGQSLRQALLGLFGRQPRKKTLTSRVAELTSGRLAPSTPPPAPRASMTPTPAPVAAAPPPPAPVQSSATKTPMVRLATPTPSASMPMKGSTKESDRLTPKPRPASESTPISTRTPVSTRTPAKPPAKELKDAKDRDLSSDSDDDRDSKDRDSKNRDSKDGAVEVESSKDPSSSRERDRDHGERAQSADEVHEEKVRPSFVPTPSNPAPAVARPISAAGPTGVDSATAGDSAKDGPGAGEP
jgi:diadenylate cyclase